MQNTKLYFCMKQKVMQTFCLSSLIHSCLFPRLDLLTLGGLPATLLFLCSMVFGSMSAPASVTQTQLASGRQRP